MSIGNCDCCDRLNVPVSHLTETYCGDVTACFLCQGDVDPDPYGEIEETCDTCGGDGTFDCWSHFMECPHCKGLGFYTAAVEPITLADLEEISA